MNPDEAFFERVMRRTYRGMVLAAGAGALAALWFLGWRWAVAFLAGAAGAYFSFSWLHDAVVAIGPDRRPPRKRVVAFAALRYVILGAAGYVIVKVFGMNAIGALVGLFVPAAAVIFEILYELLAHERA